MEPDGILTHEYLRILRKNLFKFLSVSVVVFLGLVALDISKKPQYRSRAVIQVGKPRMETNPFGQREDLSQEKQLYNTQREILRSRIIINPLIAILDSLRPGRSGRMYGGFASTHLKIKAVKNTDLIEIFGISDDSLEAKDIANHLVALYGNYQKSRYAKKMLDLKNWISYGISHFDSIVKSSIDTIPKKREEKNLEDYMALADLARKKLEKFNEALIEVEIELLQKEANVKKAKKALKKGSLNFVPSFLRNEHFQQLQNKLLEARLTEKSYHAIYKSKHPKMEEITRDLKVIQTQIWEEVKARFAFVETDYQNAKDNLETLNENVEAQKVRLFALQNKITLMSSKKREFETQINVLNDLVERNSRILLGRPEDHLSIFVVDKASVSTNTRASNLLTSLLIDLLISIFVGAGFIALIEFLDPTIKEAEDAEGFFPVPIFQSLPDFSAKKSDVVRDPKAIADKQATLFRRIASYVESNKPPAETANTLVVTSSFPEEGKSFVAVNLAKMLGENGKSVLLIDSDFKRPALFKFFDVESPTGFTETFYNKAPIETFIQPSGTKNLDILLCQPSKEISGFLTAVDIETALRTVFKKYDHIIFDAPPVPVTPEVGVIASCVNSILFLCRAGKSNKYEVSKIIRELCKDKSAKCSILLNFARITKKQSLYDYYYS